jgi:hypothetical protein
VEACLHSNLRLGFYKDLFYFVFTMQVDAAISHQSLLTSFLKYSDILSVEVLGIPQLGFAPRKVQP